MLNTVKNAMHTIGDSTGGFARRVGSEATDLAKSFGSGTADLARRIGPRRVIISVAIVGIVVGGSIWLARYLRARKEELPIEANEEQPPGHGQQRHGARAAEQYSH